jgi:hypothetical protein
MQQNSPYHLDFRRWKNGGNPMLRIPQPTKPRLPKVHPNSSPTKTPEKHGFPRGNLTAYTNLENGINALLENRSASFNNADNLAKI